MKRKRKDLYIPNDPEDYVDLARISEVNGEYHRVGFEHYETEEDTIKVTNWYYKDDKHSTKAAETHSKSGCAFGRGFRDTFGRLICESVYYED